MTTPACWIRCTEPDAAEGALRALLDRLRGPEGRVANILVAHGERPHTLEAHLALYRSVPQHARNTVPPWFLEAVGVLVSRINGCGYCVAHHRSALRRLVPTPERFGALDAALASGRWAPAFAPRERAALAYADRLTREPARVGRADLQAMLDAGWTDGEVLEVNQVASYFAYANRTALGLGVTLAGETGHEPSEEDAKAG